MRILLVEDDSRVASFIRRGLREEQYTVDVAKDGEDALFLAQTGEYDLVILDLMLPKRNGLDVLRTLREERTTTPVLILTAKDELSDKVRGLDAGADDYLAKPFGFEELLARIRALLRRRGALVPTVLRDGVTPPAWGERLPGIPQWGDVAATPAMAVSAAQSHRPSRPPVRMV